MIKTGNIQNNVENLKKLLLLIKYPEQPDNKVLTSGAPEVYLPILHYTLFNYSQQVAQFLSENKFDMFAKNDLDFINTSFKCLIKLFNYKPLLSSKQFFSDGFAEGKIILCVDVINIIRDKHKVLSGGKGKKICKDSCLDYKLQGNSQVQEEYCNKQERNSNNYGGNDYDNNNINNNNINNNYDNNFYDNNNFDNYDNNYINNINNIDNNIDINNNINNNINNSNNSNVNNDIYQNNLNNDTYNQGNYYMNNDIYSSSSLSNNTQNIENVTIKNIPNSSIHSSTFNSLQNSSPTTNNTDFTVLVQVISSLSNSVTQMANKIEKFKTNIEDRLNKVEAEISIIKNRQNILEDKLNISNESNKKIGFNSSIKSSMEMNDQIFSFAADKNIDNYQSAHFNVMNSNMNPSTNINNDKTKYEDTDIIIKNVEKKFRETRQLLSQLNDTGKIHNIYNKED